MTSHYYCVPGLSPQAFDSWLSYRLRWWKQVGARPHDTLQQAHSSNEGNVLFNDALNTFYLRLYGVRHMVKDHSVREETCFCHMGYSFCLAARALYHRQDSTYHRPLLHHLWSTGWKKKMLNGSTMKDQSNDPSHHE